MNKSCDFYLFFPVTRRKFTIYIKTFSDFIFQETTATELDGYWISFYYTTIRLVHESIIFLSMVHIRLS
jgi:hypothetical protein